MQIGFIGLLTLLFIGLKLIGYIAWSWVWVLSPLWISALFWLTVLIITAAELHMAHLLYILLGRISTVKVRDDNKKLRARNKLDE